MRDILSRLGAVRLPLVAAAVLTLSLASASAQVVEQPQTWDNLNAQWPCNNGLTNRIARVMDADSTSDIGGGGGSTQVWVQCDGVDTWSIVSIGGGASGPADALAPAVVIEGTTADAFEGNFTFADPTADWTWNWLAAGAMRGPDGTSALPAYGFSSDPNTGIYLVVPDALSVAAGGVDAVYFFPDLSSFNVAVQSWEGYRNGSAKKYCWSDVANPSNSPADTCLSRAATGIVTIENVAHLVPLASPPRTCDATAEGDLYADTSHALCWCDASTWQKLSGAGTCV